jgi:hypothetical protein
MLKHLALMGVLLLLVGCGSPAPSSSTASHYSGEFSGTMTYEGDTVPADVSIWISNYRFQARLTLGSASLRMTCTDSPGEFYCKTEGDLIYSSMSGKHTGLKWSGRWADHYGDVSEGGTFDFRKR